ncbi:hypothetical protein RclHR1_02310015 [Rhizophagus clarus]|uniref:Sel1 repeat family protein n=1 Tax=Rhizophagus clarus TaxID=94130 RepID=A0A2Z6R8Y8_9GLOM|nr:hypothetical protein RclHR1_02310015 [Rhizophagus clarus]GES87825.1 Sel1 repeat family protein [Rhizophagus clarus]
MSLNEVDNKLEINISENDENFLKNIINDLYHKIIEMNDFNGFEIFLSKWIENKFKNVNKDPKLFLKLMKNHRERKFWFTSLIGLFYQLGIYCKLDKEKAVEFYLLAINNETGNDSLNRDFDSRDNEVFNLLRERNIIIGKYLLSLFYYKDIILDFNYILRLQTLVENNDIRAHYNLAICYKNGIGIRKDEKKAFDLLLISAKKGNTDAQYYLAICYMDGMGTQKDKKKALKWFLKSENKYFKIILNKNENKFKRILELAISDDSIAQNNVGNYYKLGEVITKNEKKAFEWYMKSAIAGCAEGQCNLGYCYENGRGTDKKSANGGYAYGQYNLGFCYENGLGTVKDDEKAFEWYLKSANNGCATAQCGLGYCYENGIGTEKDMNKAHEWYFKFSAMTK